MLSNNLVVLVSGAHLGSPFGSVTKWDPGLQVQVRAYVSLPYLLVVNVPALKLSVSTYPVRSVRQIVLCLYVSAFTRTHDGTTLRIMRPWHDAHQLLNVLVLDDSYNAWVCCLQSRISYDKHIYIRRHVQWIYYDKRPYSPYILQLNTWLW